MKTLNAIILKCCSITCTFGVFSFCFSSGEYTQIHSAVAVAIVPKCRAEIVSHTSTAPHMATGSRTTHTYSHTCIYQRAAVSFITHNVVWSHRAEILQKSHHHCDTVADSVMQTECQTDTVALASQFRLCQQLFDAGRLNGRSPSRWSTASGGGGGSYWEEEKK